MSSALRYRPLSRYAAALLFFALALGLSFHTVVLHPGSRVACCFGDGTSTLRDFWAASVQHRNPFTFTHDALDGAPGGVPRTPATLLANGGLQSAFVWGLRDVLGLVGAWNAFFFLGMLGTSLAMFALLARLGCTFTASLFGGYVFGFSTYTLERAYAGHLGLLENWIFVLVVTTILGLRARRSAASAALVGLTIGLAFYLSAYQGLLASVVAFAFFLVELARLPSGRERMRSLVLAAWGCATIVISLLPILALYVSEHAAVAETTSHPINDAFDLGARMGAYFLPSPRNPLFHWLRGVHPTDLTEQTLFVGYTTWILAIVAVILMLRRNPWFMASERRLWAAISFVLLVPIAFWISLPPSYHVGSYYIPTGSAPLVLLTSFWRAYSRLGLVVGFALAALAALGLSALAQRRGRGWRLLPPLALALVVCELLPGNIGAVNTNTRPDWVNWLATHPHGIVATYPNTFGRLAAINLAKADYWYQRLDDDPLFEITGLSQAMLLSKTEAIRLVSSDIDRPLSAGVLATEGVRYAVVHDEAYRNERLPLPRPDRRHFTLLAAFAQVQIYSVHAGRVDIPQVLASEAAEIARLQGIKPPALHFGRGFGPAPAAGASRGRWLPVTGVLAVADTGLVTHVTLTGKAFASSRPRLLEVESASGRILTRLEIPTHELRFRTRPFRVPELRAYTLLLRVVPASPERTRAGSGVFLSGLAVSPQPIYSGTGNT